MICPVCGFNNRQGVRFCEQCGTELIGATGVHPAQSTTCVACGAVNTIGMRYCGQCGGDLMTRVQARGPKVNAPMKRSHPAFRRVLKRIVIALVLILLFLMILGMVNPSQAEAPEYPSEEVPMVLLQGDISTDGSMSAEPGNFAVLASDPKGIQRVELYADGELVAAENPGSDQVVFEPPIEDLPPNTKEVFVRVTNTDGQTTQTAIVPVDITDEEAAGETNAGTLNIEPDPLNLPKPENLQAVMNEDQNKIMVTWQADGSPEGGSKVYMRFPDAAGMILVKTLPTGNHETILAVSVPGVYEIFVSMMDPQGGEGPLVSTTVDTPARSGHLEVSSVIDEARITQAHLQFRNSRPDVDGVYFYIRIGGPQNLFQRWPDKQGGFMATDYFNLPMADLDWLIREPLPIDVEVWGYKDGGAELLSRFNVVIQLQDVADGRVEFKDSAINVTVDMKVEGAAGSGAGEQFEPSAEKVVSLPPPSNLHLALSISDCQEVASEPGAFLNRTRKLCMDNLNHDSRNFLVWDWPGGGSTADGTEADISGFEIRLYQHDANGVLIGQNMASIPYPEARGMTRLEGMVACGVKQSWFLRAVGPGAASEWVYAGFTQSIPCAPPYPPYNGCGGQVDLLPSWLPLDDFPPDLWFTEVCNKHDQCYVKKWSGTSKVDCDNEFLKDMRNACDRQGLGERELCYTMAETFYEAVNLFGEVFYEGSISARDCIRAHNPITCGAANIPNPVKVGIDVGVAAGKYTWEGVKTGAGTVVDLATDPVGTIRGWLP